MNFICLNNFFGCYVRKADGFGLTLLNGFRHCGDDFLNWRIRVEIVRIKQIDLFDPEVAIDS